MVDQWKPVTLRIEVGGNGQREDGARPGAARTPRVQGLRVRHARRTRTRGTGSCPDGRPTNTCSSLRPPGRRASRPSSLSFFDPRRGDVPHGHLRRALPLGVLPGGGERRRPRPARPRGDSAARAGRPVHTRARDDPGRDQAPVHAGRWFLILQLVPLASLVAAVAVRRRRDRFAGEAGLERFVKAPVMARRELRAARKALEAGDSGAVCSCVSRAVVDFIGARLKVGARGMTLPELDRPSKVGTGRPDRDRRAGQAVAERLRPRAVRGGGRLGGEREAAGRGRGVSEGTGEALREEAQAMRRRTVAHGVQMRRSVVTCGVPGSSRGKARQLRAGPAAALAVVCVILACLALVPAAGAQDFARRETPQMGPDRAATSLPRGQRASTPTGNYGEAAADLRGDTGRGLRERRRPLQPGERPLHGRRHRAGGPGYERALRLDGSHEDAAANLEFVREQLADRQVRVGGALSDAVERIFRRADVGRLAVVVRACSTSWPLACVVAGVLRGAFQPVATACHGRHGGPSGRGGRTARLSGSHRRAPSARPSSSSQTCRSARGRATTSCSSSGCTRERRSDFARRATSGRASPWRGPTSKAGCPGERSRRYRP